VTTRPRDRLAPAGAERLDRYLVRTGLAPSRRAAAAMIERGAVIVNGRRCRKSAPVAAADRVEVAETLPTAAIEPNPDLALDVLYSDGDVVVVNKPGGMPCHPLRPGERDTVMNAMAAQFPETATAGTKPNEGGLVHRLDNGTSGALLIARNRETLVRLRAALRGGGVERRYRALVSGNVARAFETSTPIAHHRRNPRKMTLGEARSARPARAGRAALTIVEPIARHRRFTLVRVSPKSGSRHQIRVHLAAAGHPIVGDRLYGGEAVAELPAGRFWLHLAEIDFETRAGARTVVKAPLPNDLRRLLR
jgi:23S rRNA pseudouridine1911/1915/1917 synthase